MCSTRTETLATMMNNQKITFVVGPPRCGSTLAYNILCSDTRTNEALNENHLLMQLSSLYQFSKQRLQIEEGHFFSNEDEVKELFTKYSNMFIEHLGGKYPDASILLLKSITLSAAAHILIEIMPDANFCLCVRDPRDIVVSMIEVGVKQQKQGINNQFPRDISLLSKTILQSYYPFVVLRPQKLISKTVVAKYEEITQNPTNAIKQLEEKMVLDLSGYNHEKKWPRTATDIESRNQRGDPFFTDKWGKPISNSSVGKYKQVLSRSEIETIETICAPIFNQFDYQVD